MRATRADAPSTRIVFTAVLAALLAFALAPAYAGEEGAGTRVGTFLSLGAGPAIEGMAGATIGFGQDLQSAAWNVAALGSMPSARASFAHTALIDGAAQEWAAVGGRLAGGATRWGLTGLYRDDGQYEVRDASNRLSDTERAFAMALAFQLARPVGGNLVAGGAVKYVGEHFGSRHGNGAAFDAGLQWHVGALGVGLAAQNFGGGMSWGQGGRWRMPATLGAGLSLEQPATGMRFACDFVAPSNYWHNLRVGVERKLGTFAAIRAGYRHDLRAPRDERLSGPALGIGAGVAGGWLDYAFSAGAADIAEHRVSFTLGSRRDAAHPLGPEMPVQGPESGPHSR